MDPKLKYRNLCLSTQKPSPWVSQNIQNATLCKTLHETSILYQQGFRPIVEMDLDLTSVSAPERTAIVLKSLVTQADALRNHLSNPRTDPHMDAIIRLLKEIWQYAGSDETLIAGYTDSAIEGYSLYLSEILPHRLCINFIQEDRDTLSSWLRQTVYASLRNGYWERDLTTDTITPGLVGFTAELYRRGGEMVFVSNRSPDMREASIKVINRILCNAASIANKTIPLFAYFGPGGSAHDSTSKQAAQRHLEINPVAGLYLGTLHGNETKYDAPPEVSPNKTVVVSVFDDRSKSREIIIETAERSSTLKKKLNLSPIASVGIAVVKHCPEILIVEAQDAITSFELDQKSHVFPTYKTTDMEKVQNTRKRVKELIGRELLNDEVEMTSLNNDFGTLMMFKEWLEMEFNVIIEPSHLSNCKTVAEVVALVEKLQANFNSNIMNVNDNRYEDLSKNADGDIPVHVQSLYERLWWGIERHDLVAATAEQQLTPTARDHILQILAPIGQDSLEQIAGWADRIKSSNDIGDHDTVEFRARFPVSVHQTWHYVNVPTGATGYNRNSYPQFTRDDDVTQMIAVSIRVLQGQSDFMSPVNALRWLTHLVADVHQPVHVGCSYIDDQSGRLQLVFDPTYILQQNLQHDQGGNRLELPIGRNVTLHSYWDSVIPGGINPSTTTFEIKQRRVKQLFEGVRLRSAKLAAPTSHDLLLWAENWATEAIIKSRAAYQSLQISTRSGTKFKVSWEGRDAYDTRCEPIVSEQLELAAARLANLLNELFS